MAVRGAGNGWLQTVAFSSAGLAGSGGGNSLLLLAAGLDAVVVTTCGGKCQVVALARCRAG